MSHTMLAERDGRSAVFRCLHPSTFSITKDAYPVARNYTYFGVQ